MAFNLPLTARDRAASWKAKIRDLERVEPPHVTILHKTRSWRVGLRDGKFLDRDPPGREVPSTVLETVTAQLPRLQAEWDRMYPENPVKSKP